MKFARTVLIERVQAEIVRREKRAAERTAEAAAKRGEQLAEYLDTTAAGWKALADTIRTRQRYGKPLIADDIPRSLRTGGYNGGNCVRVWAEPRGETYTADTAPLAALLALLQSAVDEEVTAASIERLGFRTAGLFNARA